MTTARGGLALVFALMWGSALAEDPPGEGAAAWRSAPPLSSIPGGARAPKSVSRLIPRATPADDAPYADLVYEGNNPAFGDERGLGQASDVDGGATAARWVAYARRVRGLYVLRDSLFSQQDHPTRQAAHAPMLPPMWIAVAVDAALAGRALEAPPMVAVDDDGGWAALETPAALFGAWPPSDALHALAVAPVLGATDEEARRRHLARVMVLWLVSEVRGLLAAGHGAQTPHEAAKRVAAHGAARVAESDRVYFGAEVRWARVVPILVENPLPKEVAEGKGFVPAGASLDAEAVRLARDALLRARLADGDVAIERYDVSQPDEVARAVAVLAPLVPRGSVGPRVHLWVTGRLDPTRKLAGEDAVPYVPALRAALVAGGVELNRVVILSKPDPVLPKGAGRWAALQRAVARSATLDLSLPVSLSTPALRALVPVAPDAEAKGKKNTRRRAGGR